MVSFLRPTESPFITSALRKPTQRIILHDQLRIVRKPYDPNKIPPDWDMAVKHGIATRFSKPASDTKLPFAEIDDMSGLPILNEQFPFFCNLERFKFLPPGYAMFFQFRRFTLKVLFIILLVSGFYNLYTNYKGNSCIHYKNRIPKGVYLDPDICLKTFPNAVSLRNKISDHEAVNNQQLLNLFTIFVLMFYYQMFRWSQKKLAVKIDERELTPGDYTFSVANIPSGDGKDISQELHRFFKKRGLPGNKELNIRRIVLVYDIREKIGLENNIDKLARKKLREEKRKQKGLPPLRNPQDLDRQIRQNERKVRLISQECAKGASKNFLGTAFITVNTRQELDEVLEYWHLPKNKRITEPFKKESEWKFGGNVLVVEQADEPRDVIWKNQGISFISLCLRRSFVLVASVCILLIFFWLILVGNVEKKNPAVESSKPKKWAKSLGISISMSLWIVILNSVLKQIMIVFNKFQKHRSWTLYDYGLAKKICWVQFFNTALTNLSIAIIFDDFWSPGGLIATINDYFITNALLTPITQLFDFGYIRLRLRRRSALRLGVESLKTQKQANSLFEDPHFDLANRYGSMLRNIYTAAFFAPIFPLGLLWTLVGCFLENLSDKYILIRRSSMGRAFGSALALEMMNQMEYMIVVFGISNLFFDHVLLGEISWASIACCVIALINAYMPMSWINEYLFGRIKPKLSSITYEEIKNDFDLDYDLANPATKESEKMFKKKIN